MSGSGEHDDRIDDEDRPGFWQRVIDRTVHFCKTRTRTTTVALIVVFLVLFGVYGYTSQVYGEHNENPLIGPETSVPTSTVTTVQTVTATPEPPPSPQDTAQQDAPAQ